MRQIFALRVTMEGTVQIGARVGDHLNLADVELGAWGVMLTRLLATEVVADDGRGQTFVSDHAVFNGMAEVEQCARRKKTMGHQASMKCDVVTTL